MILPVEAKRSGKKDDIMALPMALLQFWKTWVIILVPLAGLPLLVFGGEHQQEVNKKLLFASAMFANIFQNVLGQLNSALCRNADQPVSLSGLEASLEAVKVANR